MGESARFDDGRFHAGGCRMLRKMRSLCRRDDGSVAVEFALLSVPFVVCLMAIVETSLMYAASIVLEGSAAGAGRVIRTGQAQQSGDPQELFEAELCVRVSRMIPCDDIKYEVITIEDGAFASVEDYEPQFDENGEFVPQGFAPGESNDVVLIRAVYSYSYITPFMNLIITGMSQAKKITLMSTTVIKNEPYEFGSG
jgi:Flp pilus assembly protein TadG